MLIYQYPNDLLLPADFREKLHLEAIVKSNQQGVAAVYMYSTYNESRLKGYDRSKIVDHYTQAWATIPLDSNETIDMRLITDRNNRIQDFTMQYRYTIQNSDQQLLIRADYGHGNKYPHMDVEIISNKQKLLSIDVVQNGSFPSYEYVVNMVLLQAEKFEPEVGAKYWVSPSCIHPNRVDYIKKRWLEDKKTYQLKTSLTVISRAVNLVCIQNSSASVDDSVFQNLVESKLSEVRNEEKKQGGELEVAANIKGEFERLPFYFYYTTEPEGAKWKLNGYNFTGSEITLLPIGYVEEIKNDEHITRGLEGDEI